MVHKTCLSYSISSDTLKKIPSNLYVQVRDKQHAENLSNLLNLGSCFIVLFCFVLLGLMFKAKCLDTKSSISPWRKGRAPNVIEHQPGASPRQLHRGLTMTSQCSVSQSAVLWAHTGHPPLLLGLLGYEDQSPSHTWGLSISGSRPGALGSYLTSFPGVLSGEPLQ